MADTPIYLVIETDGYDSYVVRGAYTNEAAAGDHVAYIDLTNERPGASMVDYGLIEEVTLATEFVMPEERN